jgi:hypothetical protein
MGFPQTTLHRQVQAPAAPSMVRRQPPHRNPLHGPSAGAAPAAFGGLPATAPLAGALAATGAQRLRRRRLGWRCGGTLLPEQRRNPAAPELHHRGRR